MGELQRQTAAGLSECMHSELSYKRLDRGRFVWPQTVDGVVAFTAGQMSYLLEAVDWRNPQHTWRPQAAG
jgi:transposase